MAPEAISTTAELKREQKKIRQGVAYAFVLSVVVVGAAHLLLPPLVGMLGSDLEGRLAFWAGANLFVLLWIIIGVGMVSTGRRHSAEDIRGAAYAPPSPKIATAVAFLQNTLEQGVITMFALLILVFLLGTTALPLVVASVLLFTIGRVTFLAGYARGAGARSFGMALTVLPSLFAVGLSAASLIGDLAA